MSLWWSDRLTRTRSPRRWWLRAPWVLDATSSWMDSLLVSHQLPFLPPSRTSSRPPSSSSLCAEEHKLSNTSTAAHVSSVLQLSAPCLHTEGSERADEAHSRHTHARARTHTHTAQFSSPTGYCFGFFLTLHPWKSPANTKRFTQISHNIKTTESWNKNHFLPCCGAIFCCGLMGQKPSTRSTWPWVSATTSHCRHNQWQWV